MVDGWMPATMELWERVLDARRRDECEAAMSECAARVTERQSRGTGSGSPPPARGDRFGSRIVVEVETTGSGRRVRWLCDCGAGGNSTAYAFRKSPHCSRCRIRLMRCRQKKRQASP